MSKKETTSLSLNDIDNVEDFLQIVYDQNLFIGVSDIIRFFSLKPSFRQVEQLLYICGEDDANRLNAIYLRSGVHSYW